MRHANGAEVRTLVEPGDPYGRDLRLADAHFGLHLQLGDGRARAHGTVDLVESKPCTIGVAIISTSLPLANEKRLSVATSELE